MGVGAAILMGALIGYAAGRFLLWAEEAKKQWSIAPSNFEMKYWKTRGRTSERAISSLTGLKLERFWPINSPAQMKLLSFVQFLTMFLATLLHYFSLQK